MGKICPKCGTYVDDGLTLCHKCGKKMAGIEQSGDISVIASQLNSENKEVKISAIEKLARIDTTTDILVSAFIGETEESVKEILYKHILSRMHIISETNSLGKQYESDRESIVRAFKITQTLKNPKFFKWFTEQIIKGSSDIAWGTLDIVRRMDDTSLLSSLNTQNILTSAAIWRKKYLMNSDNFKGSLIESELRFQTFSLCEYLSDIPESEAIEDLHGLGLRSDPYSKTGIFIRRIGKNLDNRGNMELMQIVALDVQSLGGNVDRLNNYWNGVGDWRS